MAMYLHLNQPQNEQQQLSADEAQDNLCSLHPDSQLHFSQSISGVKRKCMDKDSSSSSSGKGSVGYRTIDPLSLIPDESKSYKRQRLDSVNSTDFSIPLTTNDESFTSSFVFLQSTVSRPASSSQNQSSTPSYSNYSTTPQDEERILREEFFTQMGPQGFHSSGSFGNLAGYSLPSYPPVPPVSPSPYMLPSFAPSMMQVPPPSMPPHYNNGYFSASDMMYGYPPSSRDQMYSNNYNNNKSSSSSSYSPSIIPSGGQPVLPEEFIAETKLSKNIKKMTTVLGQVPGLEKIRWQSILQGTRSPDVGERETQRRVKEAETIGARLFGGDIDKLLGSILNQHLDFLVTYVANLKHGKKKHNKIRMQLAKVLQDTAPDNDTLCNSNC